MSPSPLTPPSPGQPRVSRRTVLIGGALALGASSLGAAGLWWPRSGPTFATLAEKPLHAHTVAFLTDTARVAVSDPSEVIPGTRVAMNAHNPAELVAREAQWLASLAPWTRDSAHADLIRDAYLDMFVLSEGLEAPVAGWTPLWRYVWPRDTAHIAVAFAAAGDVNRAQRALDFLARVPRTARGWFEARYTLDARGAPDDRAPQFDGLGWTAWALGWITENGFTQPLSDGSEPTLAVGETADARPWARSRGEFVRRYEPLIHRLTATLLHGVHITNGQVPVSSDYWEIRENTVTLGTVAPTLAGLQHLAVLHAELGDKARARECASAAETVAQYVVSAFGSRGYPRRADGYTVDCAIPFLCPPYTRACPDPTGVGEALVRAGEVLRQPAGGLTPGEDWHRDGVSWTPETAVFALVEAHLPTLDARTRAVDRLTWLGRHRTSTGTLTEKVLSDGSPSAVAPLAWTAATVALTTHALSVVSPVVDVPL